MDFIPSISAPPHVDSAHWFVFHEQRLLVESQSLSVPRLADAAALGFDLDERVFIGSLRGAPGFAARLRAPGAAPAGMAWESLRGLFARADAALVAAASRAVQLVTWDADHRYCGRCATPTTRQAHEHSRICPQCTLVAYPRITPAMMALVTRGRELLLARAPRFPEGMFSALAGFVEAGESVEDTVRREVREEVGIEVGALRYFGSQSWPFPNSLMLAFVCEYAGGEICPQEAEIAEAGWFDAARLPRIPPTISIAGQMIQVVARELIAAGE